MKPVLLKKIADTLSVPLAEEYHGQTLTGIDTLSQATETEMSFLARERYADDFYRTHARVVLIQQDIRVDLSRVPHTLVLKVPDADLAVARVLPIFAQEPARPDAGIDPLACVASSAVLGEGCAVGPFVKIGRDVRIGARCILHDGVSIGDEVTIGDDCELFSHVVVRERISIGNRVVIHAGSVLGTDGFGYRWNGQAHEKIPQIGTVIVEDDVEIGSCVCIDRAKFAATRIGRGTKIDNLVQVAHNVVIGPHCIIVGQAGIAGSARLGAGVVMGGQSALRDHITLGDGVMVAARAGVLNDVKANSVVSGLPAVPHRQSLRMQVELTRLPKLAAQVRKLQEQLDKLTENGDSQTADK